MDPAAKRKRDARTQPTVGAKAPATTDYNNTDNQRNISPRDVCNCRRGKNGLGTSVVAAWVKTSMNFMTHDVQHSSITLHARNLALPP